MNKFCLSTREREKCETFSTINLQQPATSYVLLSLHFMVESCPPHVFILMVMGTASYDKNKAEY